MARLDHRWPSEPNPVFLGREREMEWLFDRSSRHGVAIVISGPPGVGKTTLVRQFLASARVRRSPLIVTARSRGDDTMIEIRERIDELHRERGHVVKWIEEYKKNRLMNTPPTQRRH